MNEFILCVLPLIFFEQFLIHPISVIFYDEVLILYVCSVLSAEMLSPKLALLISDISRFSLYAMHAIGVCVIRVFSRFVVCLLVAESFANVRL